jgi:hypothetical protein
MLSAVLQSDLLMLALKRHCSISLSLPDFVIQAGYLKALLLN